MIAFRRSTKFIKSPGQVQRIDDTHFSFSSFRNGKEQRAESLRSSRQTPERRIAWRTIAEEVGLGVVCFEPRSNGATEITLKLHSIFDPSISGHRADAYLRKFKGLMENQTPTF